METLRLVLMIILAVDCVGLIWVALLQQGKGQGLGALAGGNTDTYWGKNKGRSEEGNLKKITAILAVIFFVLALILNIDF